MEENINIHKYKNDINGLKELIKSCLISVDNKEKKLITSNLYMDIIEELNNILSLSEQDFLLNNNFTRHMLIFGDIPIFWTNDIIIHIKSLHEKYYTYWLDNLVEKIKLQEITILEQNKKYLKFILNISDKNYTFIIKERNDIYDYGSHFEINQLEYDIKNKLLVNNLTNNLYSVDDPHISNIKKLDLFSDLDIDLNTKYNYIIEQTQINPFIIFELIELLVNFPNFFNIIEVNNFLLNLNGLLETEKSFIKSIRKICEKDEELIFYKRLIKFAYYLEENGLYYIYIQYLLNQYPSLMAIIAGVKINIELFNLFDNLNTRDIIYLLIFQHLIYQKKRIFKKSKKSVKRQLDLMDIFIDGNNLESLDTMNEFSLMDKSKFKSLRFLKETAKTFIKFDNLIKMIPINFKDQTLIKHFYNINIILYTELKDSKIHHSLKLAYIIKRFHLVPRDLLEKIVIIFNYVITKKKYDKNLLIQNNFIDIITSKVLNDWMFKKMTFIPNIKKNFENNIDCIDIMDYQDTFILFIEFIYKNKHDYLETDNEIMDFFDSVFEASICDMRSYRIFKNDARRKKEKKIKKAKKEKKEQKKSKYKIVKDSILNNLEEHPESNDDSTVLDDIVSEDMIESEIVNNIASEIINKIINDIENDIENDNNELIVSVENDIIIEEEDDNDNIEHYLI
jgi:hypothetical protein